MEKEYPQLKKLMDSYKSEDALKEFYDKYYIDIINFKLKLLFKLFNKLNKRV